MSGGTLVTGGVGFLGRHLTSRLREAGERVRVLDLDPPQRPVPGVEYVRGSVTDPAAVRDALQEVDTVFHVAGNPDLWARTPGEHYRVNHGGTRQLLRQAGRAGVRKVVHTSTEAILRVYPGSRPALRGTGDLPPLDAMPGSYCRSKWLAEKEALDSAAAGLPVVVVSPAVPVGPGDRNLTPPSRMILDFLNGELPAFLDGRMSLADVRDVAEGHRLAAERGAPGRRYVIGQRDVRLHRVLEILREMTGRPMPRLRLPRSVALAAAAAQELVADHLTGEPPPGTVAGVKIATAPLPFDPEADARELGLGLRPAARALRDAVRWFDRAGLLEPPLPRRR